MRKGGHPLARELRSAVGGHPNLRIKRCAKNVLASVNPSVQYFRAACSLAEDEAAPILARFYMSPPANPGGLANEDGVFWNRKPA